MNPKIVGGVIVGIVVLVVGFGIVAGRQTGPTRDLTKFAQCLTDKGLVMYGAAWCPHCQREKKGFGEAFKYVSYVECPDNPKLCTEKGISGYPTWILEDGTKLEGEQGVEKLSTVTGCVIE